MKQNYNIAIVGEHCVLVPYRPEHVPTYHGWMQDPDLLEATASEALSLDQEYKMQQTWRDDETKCTFIVLARELLPIAQQEDIQLLLHGNNATGMNRPALQQMTMPADFIQNSLGAMVGDVNFFLSDEEDEPEDDDKDNKRTNRIDVPLPQHPESHSPYSQAELEIMIAVSEYRRKGMGREALLLMMMYGVMGTCDPQQQQQSTTNNDATTLGLVTQAGDPQQESESAFGSSLRIRRFFGKINEDNTASRNLFQHHFGFVQCSYAACFREIEFELVGNTPEELKSKLMQSFATVLNNNKRKKETRQMELEIPTKGDFEQAQSDALDILHL